MLRGHRCARQWPDGRLPGDCEKKGFPETGTELSENVTLRACAEMEIFLLLTLPGFPLFNESQMGQLEYAS